MGTKTHIETIQDLVDDGEVEISDLLKVVQARLEEFESRCDDDGEKMQSRIFKALANATNAVATDIRREGF